METKAYQYQEQAAGLLETTNRNLLIIAPTGAGKTEVGFLGLEHGGRGIYVAPTRALCHEKSQWLKERFPSVKVVVGNKDYSLTLGGFHGSEIRVLTPWKLGVILHNDPNFARYCSVVVLDEIHNLDPDTELIVTKMKQLHPGVRLVGLSATIHEDDEQKFASWLDAVVVKSEERPVPLVSRIVHFEHDIEVYRDGEVEERVIVSFTENGRDLTGSGSSLPGCQTAAQRVLAVVDNIRCMGDDAPILVYTPYRERARQITEDLTRWSSNDWDEALQAGADGLPAEAGDFTDTLKAALPVGVGLHHGGCTAQERELIHDLAARGKLHVVVTCDTLVQGVNLPARHVIVESVYQEHDAGGERRLISTSKFWQVAGRAGRPQFDSIGYVWIVTTSEIELVEVEEVLLKQKASRIESRVYGEYFLTSHIAGLIQLGYSTPKKLVEFLRATFFGRTFQDDQPLVEQFERIIARLIDENFAMTVGKFLALTDRGHRLARLGMHPSEYAVIEHLIGAENAEYEDWVRGLVEACGEYVLRGKRKPTEEEVDGVVAYGMTAYALKTSWATRELVDYVGRLLELTFTLMKFNGVDGDFQRVFRRNIADRFLFGEIEFARKLARVLPTAAVKRILRNFGPSLNQTDPTTGDPKPLTDDWLRSFAKVVWGQVGIPQQGNVLARVAGVLGVTESRFRRLAAAALEEK